MKKLLPISLKLKFTLKILGFYGLSVCLNSEKTSVNGKTTHFLMNSKLSVLKIGIYASVTPFLDNIHDFVIINVIRPRMTLLDWVIKLVRRSAVTPVPSAVCPVYAAYFSAAVTAM